MAKTIPFKNIPHKVITEQFASLQDPYPKILGGFSLSNLVESLFLAKQAGKPIIWALGAYMTKCGLSPLLLEMNKMGYATHLIMNGAAAIHDMEIGLFGETSEWVENSLLQGKFGFSEETGQAFIDACNYFGFCGGNGGLAYFLKKAHFTKWHADHMKHSLICKFDGPILCFSSMGTETIYQHPWMSSKEYGAIAEMTRRDFQSFTNLIPQLNDGGVYINCCSSVVLPEIFMKCFSVCANEKKAPKKGTWTACVLDKREQYRCTENVLRRPAGKPIQILSEIEISIPTIFSELKKLDTIIENK